MKKAVLHAAILAAVSIACMADAEQVYQPPTALVQAACHPTGWHYDFLSELLGVCIGLGGGLLGVLWGRRA